MAEAEAAGNHYWSLVEPVWLPLNRSWDDGPDEFLRQFRDIRAEIGHLYAAHWCQSEVCNGGLHQFFSNSTGILAPEALQGFRAIDLQEWASILAEAMQFFGTPYPRERYGRWQRLQILDSRKPPEWDMFKGLNKRFYAWLHAESDRWERAADVYSAKFSA